MKAPTLVLFAGFLGLSAAHALDLTPRRATRELEGGFQIEILQFEHEGRTVHYRPPGGWEVSGGATSLTLTPADIPQAIAKIAVVPRTSKSGAVATPDEALEKWVTSGFLPPEATDVERVEINESPFMLGPIPSREYLYRFRRSTTAFMKSICVVDLNDKERVVVEVTAGTTQFESTYRPMIRSMFSWTLDE